MKKCARFICILALCMGMTVPALADEASSALLIQAEDTKNIELTSSDNLQTSSDCPADITMDAINWAVTKNIADTTEADCFHPDTVCTLGEAVTFLWRANGSPEPTIDNPFPNGSILCCDEKAVLWAYEKGLFQELQFDGSRPCPRNTIIIYLWKLAGQPGSEKEITNSEREWNLLLVNPWNTLPEGFSVELASIGGGHSVDARCTDALRQMLADCRAAGLSPAVCSSYRTQKKQESLFNKRVANRMARGMSREEAVLQTARSTAVPNTSEHQTGLAVDIVDNHNWKLNASQASMPAQKWLMEHSWEYGFILRYSAEKSDLTGIIYEPWHYRYVGKDAAQTIYEQGLCLEEYLHQLDMYQLALSWVMHREAVSCVTPAEFGSDETCTRGELITLLYQSFSS